VAEVIAWELLGELFPHSDTAYVVKTTSQFRKNNEIIHTRIGFGQSFRK
jgi:hypothetical protein